MDLATRAMALEPEDAPRRRGPHLDEPEFVVAAGPRRVLLSNEIDVGMRLVGRPVRAEVVEELVPVLEAVALEIGDREAEGVVDPGDEPRPRLRQVDQPLGNLLDGSSSNVAPPRRRASSPIPVPGPRRRRRPAIGPTLRSASPHRSS